ncbi:MAG: DNA-binding response regulator [Ideonella sp.]|nr:DNA-binding response regulator [Ideonella sp.]
MLRVLVADGNELARRFSARVVRDAFRGPIDLVECGDAEAVEQAWPAPPSPGESRLLLVDLALPPAGATRLLRPHAPATVQVVTLLYADDEALFPLLQAGADGYLLKEDRYESMVEQLQRIAQGWPPITPALARQAQARLGARASAADAASTLSPDEAQLLSHLSKGFTLREVAQQLKVDPRAAAALVRSVYRQLRGPATAG